MSLSQPGFAALAGRGRAERAVADAGARRGRTTRRCRPADRGGCPSSSRSLGSGSGVRTGMCPVYPTPPPARPTSGRERSPNVGSAGRMMDRARDAAPRSRHRALVGRARAARRIGPCSCCCTATAPTSTTCSGSSRTSRGVRRRVRAGASHAAVAGSRLLVVSDRRARDAEARRTSTDAAARAPALARRRSPRPSGRAARLLAGCRRGAPGDATRPGPVRVRRQSQRLRDPGRAPRRRRPGRASATGVLGPRHARRRASPRRSSRTRSSGCPATPTSADASTRASPTASPTQELADVRVFLEKHLESSD